MADETRNAKLLLGVETKGTDKAASSLKSIGKGATDLQKELGKMSRTAGLDKLAKEFGEVARQTDDVGGSVDELNKKLKELGANQDEIKSVARAFETERSRTFDSGGGGGGSGGNAPAAAKFRGIAGLVGGEGASNIVGVADDIQDAVEGVGQLGSVLGSSLNPAMLASGLVIAGVAAAFTLAISDIRKQQQEITEDLNARRTAVEAAFAGATVGEAQAAIEGYNNSIKAQTFLLEDANKKAADAFKTAQEESGDLAARIDILFGISQVNPFLEDVGKSNEKLEEAQDAQKGYQSALDAGLFKTEEVTAKEQELAHVRATETTAAIDTAKDAERERAREADKAARDQERAQQQVEREAEKAAAEQERNAERAAAAQDKYNQAIENAGTQFKQATADINTKLGQSLTDNTTALFRDATDIAEKFRRDTFDAEIKANQAERDALTDHLRDIDDIREEGRKSERDAIQEGDFKALYLARRSTEENLRNEQKETQRETSDRKRADQEARADLLRNAQRERGDRLLNYERQNSDTRLAAQRELQQAQLARSRSLEAASNSYRAELQQLGQYLQQRNQMQAQANQQALQQMGQGTRPGGGSAGSAFNASQTIPLNMIPLNMISAAPTFTRMIKK